MAGRRNGNDGNLSREKAESMKKRIDIFKRVLVVALIIMLSTLLVVTFKIVTTKVILEESCKNNIGDTSGIAEWIILIFFIGFAAVVFYLLKNVSRGMR